MSNPTSSARKSSAAVARETAATILEALRVLVGPGQVVELRVPQARVEGRAAPLTVSGYYDAEHLDRMARAAARLTTDAPAVYFTLNPVSPDLLARRCNRSDVVGKGETTEDADIVGRQWLLVDIDPRRRKHISATDAERAAAMDVAYAIADDLADAGWSLPLFVDSGNGYHLLYRVDLPNDDAATGLVRRCLLALASRYDTGAVEIDTTVFNASRISKLPGTWARKGDPTADRPHRQSRIITGPEVGRITERDLLEALAATAPTETGTPTAPVTHQGDAGQSATVGNSDRTRQIRRARAYIARMPGAVSGDHGHDRTFEVAALLTHEWDLTEAEAWPLMQEYNARCSPSWSEEDLRRKLREGIERGQGERGRLAREHRERPGHREPSEPSEPSRNGVHHPPNTPPTSPTPVTQQVEPPVPVGPWTNFRTVTEGETTRRVGISPAAIAGQLWRATDGWPRVAGGQLFVRGHEYKPLWIDSTAALLAWATPYFSRIGGSGIDWAEGREMVTKNEIREYLTQHGQQYDVVEGMPHEPAFSRAYYLHPPIAGGDGAALARLVGYFTPATALDRELIRALFLTLFWGGRPGSRPAFLIDSDDKDAQGGRGVGKSTLAELASELVGGCIGLRPGESLDDIITRALSPNGLRSRVILLDNLKTRKFSWGDFEGAITLQTLSGRVMYVGEGSRPNNLTWLVTVNRGTLSRDMAQRCVPIHVARPTHSAKWRSEISRFIDEFRMAITGDILAELQRAVPALVTHSRWSDWEDSVLSHTSDPAGCQKLIADRQGDADQDAEEGSIIREAIIELLWEREHRPEREAVILDLVTLATLLTKVTGEKVATTGVTKYLKTITIAELKKSRRDGNTMWLWTGSECPPDLPAIKLHDSFR